MKIIKRKSDNIVLFVGEEFTWEAGILKSPDFVVPSVLESEYEIVEVDGVPEDWLGNNYAYNQSWVKTPEALAATEAERDQAELNQKRQLKIACEEAILTHIQSKVDAYNAANLLSLSDVYRCEQYSRHDGYAHQAFCAAVWAWNVQVWETVRQILAQAMAGEITITSPADAIAMLPEFVAP